MKKLLSLALSVIMAVTLAAPAFADEAPLISPNPISAPAGGDAAKSSDPERAELAGRLNLPAETEEYWLDDETWVWIAAHEEETRQFLAEGIHSQIQARGFDSLEELAGYWDWDQDSTVLLLVENWVYEQQSQERLEQFELDHPGMLEQFRANAYDYFAQEYPYYGSAQRYMEIWELTEEEFLQRMVMYQVSAQLVLEEQQAYVQQQKTELGGVPGQLGVMVNGAYIAFSDAVPELVNGRTMVPAQALLEALGGEAAVNGDRIECTMGDLRITFTLDSTQARTETAGGESRLLEMDCAPYVKDGCVYIPIRFAGDALGCYVGWDDTFETAVVIDAQRLADGIDQEFTILNRAMAAAVLPREEGMNLFGKAEGTLALTLLDSLHGDKVYHMDLSEEFLANDDAFNIALAITATEETIDLLLEDMPDDDLELYLMMQAMLADLGKMDLIVTREGQSWFHSPMLDELGGEANVWFAQDMDQDTLQTLFSGLNARTVGQMLADSQTFPGVFTWGNLLMEAQEMAGAVGDDCFVTADGVSTLTIDLETLAQEDPSLWMDYAELSFTLTVDEEGQIALSGCAENAPYYYGDTAVRLTLEYTLSGGEMSLELEVHAANIMKLELSLTARQQASDQQPLTCPPEGAVVMDADMPSPL